jgi:hypothetical protein
MNNLDMYKQKLDQLCEFEKLTDRLRDEMDFLWYSLTQEELDKVKEYSISKNHKENIIEIIVEDNQ